MHIGIETAEPAPDDVAEGAGKRRGGGIGRSFVECPGQLDCVEGVSARHFVNASHRRAREGSTQPGRDRGVQLVDTQRIQANTVDRFGPRQLQPGRARTLVGFGAHAAEDSDGSGEATRGECEDVNAGRIEPLQIVDRQQHRPAVGESLDHRQERGRDRTLIGHGAVVAAQQHLVDGEHLWSGQVGPGGRVDVIEHVRQGRVRQHRFRGRRARGEDPEAAGLRLLDRS